jgi:hypothetical protein
MNNKLNEYLDTHSNNNNNTTTTAADRQQAYEILRDNISDVIRTNPKLAAEMQRVVTEYEQQHAVK